MFYNEIYGNVYSQKAFCTSNIFCVPGEECRICFMIINAGAGTQPKYTLDHVESRMLYTECILTVLSQSFLSSFIEIQVLKFILFEQRSLKSACTKVQADLNLRCSCMAFCSLLSPQAGLSEIWKRRYVENLEASFVETLKCLLVYCNFQLPRGMLQKKLQNMQSPLCHPF